jgi:hypothetical protein
VEEISKINKRINKSGGGGSSSFSSTPAFGGVGAGPVSGFNLTQPEDDD